KYIDEVMCQLNNTQFYKVTTKEVYTNSIVGIWQLLMEWKDKGLLLWEEYCFLKRDFPKLPVLYILPKIHKNRTNPPGRPIVSSC
ncbi:hypothetical protein NDU88_005135, partial [Pleurodeles waltl]